MTTPTHAPSEPRNPARLLPLAVGVLLFLLAAPSALAQTFSGLSGTVQDTSKASVKGAKVTVTSLETGVARVATTSSAGFYSFPDLLVGHYRNASYHVHLRQQPYRRQRIPGCHHRQRSRP